MFINYFDAAVWAWCHSRLSRLECSRFLSRSGLMMYNLYITFTGAVMHRTQIYLPDQLHEQLKIRSRANGISVSALIRQVVEKDLQRNAAPSDARQFFDQMTPLESFADCEPEEYVRAIRSKSRILRDE
jgi:plasmid stability protein